jgi:predicted RNase H-like HicB family nuclease
VRDNRDMKKTASKKTIRSFSVVYEADPEGGYIAFIPSLPGCHTQGETLEEAERNIKEAAELYLEDVLAEQGVLPRETRTLQM